MDTFTGVLAVLNRTTPDGRRLAEPTPELSGPMPLPLLRPGGYTGVGHIDQVWRDGDLIHYAGTLNGKHPEADKIATEIRGGRLVGMLDADVLDMEYLHQGQPIPDGEEIPFDAQPGDMCVAMHGWRVKAATLLPSEEKAWPEITLTLNAVES